MENLEHCGGGCGPVMDREDALIMWLTVTAGIPPRVVLAMTRKGFDSSVFAEASEGSLRGFADISNRDLVEELIEFRKKNIDHISQNNIHLLLDKKIEELRNLGMEYISAVSPYYPESLLGIPSPPAGLYVKGSLPDASIPSLAIIGARECSDYGREMAVQFGAYMASKGVQVISGMARGIDSIGQRAAITYGGRSFGVLGCGADICYPKESAEIYQSLLKNGGIISEYTPGTPPIARNFPARNRIISGLSDMVLVIEARDKSGTSITVDMALGQGREVYAVPGRINERLSLGCNRLISAGAGMALSPGDLYQELMLLRSRGEVCDEGEGPDAPGEEQVKGEKSGISKKRRRRAALSPETGNGISLRPTADSLPESLTELGREIFKVLDYNPMSLADINDVLRRKGMTADTGSLGEEILAMVLSGHVRQVQGGYYVRRDV